MDWSENPSIQKFDIPQPKSKIGSTSQPYIKTLEVRRHPNKFELSKIGESEVYSRIDKEKNIQLKIGHGSP